MRAVHISIIVISAILLFVALILTLTAGGGQEQPILKLNATCIHQNLTGRCKSIDTCLTNLPRVKLEPCNKGDLSLVCCPLDETTIPKKLVQLEQNATNSRPKRTPGEKAKEMCKVYGETAYRLVPTHSFFGPEFVKETDCKVSEPLIKGGEDAEEREFPHMVRLGNFQEDLGEIDWICGGSLVSPEFILSAAHCPVSKEYGYAMYGTHKMEYTEAFFWNHMVSISEVFIHPQYNGRNNENDIALFQLSIKLNTSERPICLDTEGSISNDMFVTATGFGLNKEQKSVDILQKVNLNIEDKGLCANKYKQIKNEQQKPIILPEYTVCAYGEGKDTCRGDSGGPLQIRNNLPCMYTQIGVTSFGANCSLTTNLPGVYTKVSTYIGWIEDIVWPS